LYLGCTFAENRSKRHEVSPYDPVWATLNPEMIKILNCIIRFKIIMVLLQSNLFIMKLTFFHRPKSKQFDYKPLYYDKEKDEREQRKKELGIIGSNDKTTLFRGDLQRRWKKDRANQKSQQSKIRFLIYLLLIIFTVYIFFFTNFVENLVSLFRI